MSGQIKEASGSEVSTVSNSSKFKKTLPEWAKNYPTRQIRVLTEVVKWCPGKVNHFRKAFEGKSRKSAITAKCLDCTAYQPDEVRHCPATACPLHPYRPYKVARKATISE